MSGLDRNGYAPSIVQRNLSRCYWCAGSHEKLDRHEIFGGSNRKKSKELGLWVMLCHNSCHLNGAHKHIAINLKLKKIGQRKAMKHYGWTTEDFIKIIGKNYLEE